MSKTGFYIDEKSLFALKGTLTKFPKRYIDISAIVQFNIGVDIISLAKTRIPLEHGTLRDSGFVQPPSYKGRTEVSVELGFTGPYAVRQHEDLEYSHPGKESTNKGGGAQGQAKYLESASKELEGKLAAALRKAIADFQATETLPTIKTSPHNTERT